MTRLRIHVSGCDDTTTIEIEVPEGTVGTIEEIAEQICEASTYGCMPTMTVEKLA